MTAGAGTGSGSARSSPRPAAAAPPRPPRAGDEAVRGPVVVPGGRGLDPLPLALPHYRPAQHAEEPAVELVRSRVDRLVRCPDQVGGDPLPPAFQLPDGSSAWRARAVNQTRVLIW